MESNNDFDCVVGISYEDKPISTGVLMSTRTIITAANPLDKYINETDKIKIHTVSNMYPNSTQREIETVFSNQSFRKQSWVTVGYNDTRHTTIHDLLLINLIESDKVSKLTERTNRPVRKPFPVKLPDGNSTTYEGEWIFAGFGYIDQEHIKDNSVLETSIAAVSDCGEWIPREWGRFICLRNDENLRGVASGAPLFRADDLLTVYGIGSFALKKGKDDVLVFTDLRPYVNKLYGYLKDDE